MSVCLLACYSRRPFAPRPTSMNTIQAVLESDSYEGEDYLMIHIDGKPLDAMLAEASPEDQLDGLVPTLRGWMEDDDDRAIVWSRFLPHDETRIRVPVLMCPEHRDLMCTTIVAEVKVLGDKVEWRRVGIDDTPEEDLPELVGQDVFWLQGVGPFEFDRREYVAVMTAFREGSVHSDTLH